MQLTLRVDTADVRAMARRWGTCVSVLNDTVAPTGLGLSCQVSAAAVNAAHVDDAAFTAGLAAQVGARGVSVAQANTRFVAQEADSAIELAGVAQPVISP